MVEGNGGQIDWLDELVAAILRLHDQILQESGGMPGVHTSSLYSACARPFQTAFGEDLFPTPFSKVAALFHAIICDHVFVDGNKRSASLSALFLMRVFGLVEVEDATPLRVRMIGDLALITAAESISVNEVTHWLRRIFDKSLLAL